MKVKTTYMFSLRRIISILFISSILISCGDNFLDVTNPDALNTSNYPATMEDVDLIVASAYGRLRKGFLNGYTHAIIGSVAHYTDQAFFRVNDFDEGAQINFNPSDNPQVTYLWTAHFENINKINGALEALEYFRSNGKANNTVLQTVNYREGELKFLRAWNYYYLINFFGETFITQAADADKMGVPIFRKVPKSIEEATVPRASIGAVWNFIKSDLRSSATLLESNTDVSAKARVNKWAAKAFLGKALIFTQQWDSAKLVLKDVIDNSGKSLVTYDVYKDMFNEQHLFNSESIFEVNYNETDAFKPSGGSWNTDANAVTNYHIIMGPYYYGKDGLTNNGYGNYIVHDSSLLRFGWTNGVKDADAYKAQSYIDYSTSIRENKSIDPRTWVNVLQPIVDSLTINNERRPVAKNPGEGSGAAAGLPNNYGWGMRKFVVTYRDYGGGITLTAINIPWLRLADIYLLYAEACKETDDNANALEYLNKVKRRAYGLPIDSPAPGIDYGSLTDPTGAAGKTDPLQTDPLKYERWIELFGEHANWWFDVCRWKIGDKEAKYFDRVTSGKLQWSDTRSYALPIPTFETSVNNIPQNPGY